MTRFRVVMSEISLSDSFPLPFYCYLSLLILLICMYTGKYSFTFHFISFSLIVSKLTNLVTLALSIRHVLFLVSLIFEIFNQFTSTNKKVILHDTISRIVKCSSISLKLEIYFCSLLRF